MPKKKMVQQNETSSKKNIRRKRSTKKKQKKHQDEKENVSKEKTPLRPKGKVYKPKKTLAEIEEQVPQKKCSMNP